MCDCRYKKKHLDSAQKLNKEDREVVNLLEKAQQQGLIDVYLVMVTHHEWLSVPSNHIDRDSDEVEQSEITCEHWRRLDGSKPDWEPQKHTLELSHQDVIVQASD